MLLCKVLIYIYILINMVIVPIVISLILIIIMLTIVIVITILREQTMTMIPPNTSTSTRIQKPCFISTDPASLASYNKSSLPCSCVNTPTEVTYHPEWGCCYYDTRNNQTLCYSKDLPPPFCGAASC